MEILRNVLTFSVITINPSDASWKEGQGAAVCLKGSVYFARIGGIVAVISAFIFRLQS